MKKIIFAFVVLLSHLYSEEPQLSQYMQSIDNSDIIFKYQQNQFHCYPYGVFTFEKLLENKKAIAECKESVKKFYKKVPQAKSFARVHYELYQFYHLEKMKNQCIIYSNGTKSYSEVLLENGYALLDQNLNDEVWKFKFYRAQKRAEILKKGVWKEEYFLLKECLKNIYEN